jgi:hypothetical protein
MVIDDTVQTCNDGCKTAAESLIEANIRSAFQASVR